MSEQEGLNRCLDYIYHTLFIVSLRAYP